MDDSFTSDGHRIASYFTRPAGSARVPAVVLSHGFPSGPRDALTTGATYPELADRMAADAGWGVLTFNFRGTGTSEGDFSLSGWLADLRSGIDVLDSRADIAGVWLVGSSLGGSLAIRAAADDARVKGVATLAAPATLQSWAREPARFLAQAREIGVVRSPGFPPDVGAWARELAAFDAVSAAAALAPRPLLVLQGTDDQSVPVADARAISGASPTAELRLVPAAGHRLRHDPRAVAALLGWLDRQRV